MNRNRFFQLLRLAGLVCLLLCGMMHVAAADTEGDFEYSVSNSKTTVTGYIGAGGDVVIPDTLGGYPVIEIGYAAFEDCSSLTSMKIPDGVTSIDYYAFSNCGNLTNVNLPDSVTSIGYYAFSGCSNLVNMNLPSSVTAIDDFAFYRCSKLTSVTIPEDVSSIGEFTFASCTNLTNVSIPNGVTSIGYSAFSDCKSLTQIEFPDSVTSIGDVAFAGCSNLTSVKIPDGVNSIGYFSFYCCDSLTNVYLPDGVTSIGESAFSDCYELTNVNFPNSVISIGDNAFFYCFDLNSVKLSKTVTSIGDGAFYSGTTIYCYVDSAADTWAQANGNPIWYICDHEAEVLPKVEPTCTEDGLTEGSKCEVCGCENKQEVLSALGHDETGEFNKDDEYHWLVCSRCNENFAMGEHYAQCTNPDVCEVCGGNAYLTFHGDVEEYQHDGKKHWQVCPDCEEILNEMPHYVFCTNASSTTCAECEAEYEERLLFHRKDYFWEYNDTHHWTRCDVCKDYAQIDDLEEHVRNEKDPIHCSKCKIELPALPGDADGNGKLEMTDVMAVLKALSAGSAGENLSKAEVNNDGVVDVKDVLMMLRSLNGWDVKLQ